MAVASETIVRDDGPRANQPGLFNCSEGLGICFHKGTTSYPAHDGMLDAGAVSGIYEDPNCPICTVDVRGVPAVGFLCMIQRCAGVPCCCYIAPFNCCTPINCSTGAEGLRKPGLKCGVGGCGYGGPKAAPCLPDCLSLAGTWFCCAGACWDWHDNDTMLTSKLCLFPQVHKKIKQGTIIC